MSVDGGVRHGGAGALARALALAALIGLGVPCAAGAASGTGARASTCFSRGYACTIDGYDATTMADNWAAKYYGPAALGDLGTPPHNCTLFAAWMLARNGLPDPGRTWGDGGAWGRTLARFTNHTPAVGAIAWYGFGADDSAEGHVGYVARVDWANRTVFVVSDNWGPWGRGATTSGWTPFSDPTGYIHLRDLSARRHRPAPRPRPIVAVAPVPVATPTPAAVAGVPVQARP